MKKKATSTNKKSKRTDYTTHDEQASQYYTNQNDSRCDDLSKFTRKLICYINNEISLNIYGLHGCGKSYFINNFIKNNQKDCKSIITLISYVDFINNSDSFQLILDAINASKALEDQESIARRYKLDKNNCHFANDFINTFLSDHKENFKDNCLLLYKRLKWLVNKNKIVLIIDDINNLESFNNSISKINKILSIFHEFNQTVILISPFCINSVFTNAFTNFSLQEIYFPYQLPIEFIETEVLTNFRVLESIEVKKKSKNSNVEIFKILSFENLQNYIYNYNEFMFYFKNYSEFFINLGQKEFNHHLNMYLVGSCFQFSNIVRQIEGDEHIKFDIYKDLEEHNNLEIVNKLSFNQKVFLMACFIGSKNTETQQIQKYGENNSKRNKKGSKYKEIKEKSSSIIRFQNALAIYYYLVDYQKTKVEKFYPLINFEYPKEVLSEFYHVDKHIDFITGVSTIII